MTFEEKLKEAKEIAYFHDMLGEFAESQVIGISVDEYGDAYNGGALLVINTGSGYVVRQWGYGTCEVCCQIQHMKYEKNLTMYDIVNKHTTHCATLDDVREHIGFNRLDDIVWRED